MRLPIIVAVAAILLSACRVNAGLVIAKTAVNPANDHTYHLLHGDGIQQVGLSWTEAEAEALQLGGHLVAINDLAEQQWIVDTFPGQPQLGSLSDSYHLWIGLNDTQTDGTFVWSNNDPVTYTRWNPGEPNNFGGDEDYVHLYNFANGAFEWNDAPDVRLFPTSGGPMSALVEVAVPEPTSLPGDANSDGVVNLIDLDILGQNYGTVGTATFAQGDFDGDGTVHLLDLDILGANFGATAPVTIPEPTSLAIGLIALVGFSLRGKRTKIA